MTDPTDDFPHAYDTFEESNKLFELAHLTPLHEQQSYKQAQSIVLSRNNWRRNSNGDYVFTLHNCAREMKHPAFSAGIFSILGTKDEEAGYSVRAKGTNMIFSLPEAYFNRVVSARMPEGKGICTEAEPATNARTARPKAPVVSLLERRVKDMIFKTYPSQWGTEDSGEYGVKTYHVILHGIPAPNTYKDAVKSFLSRSYPANADSFLYVSDGKDHSLFIEVDAARFAALQQDAQQYRAEKQERGHH